MAAIGATLFAVVLWGAILGVALVFAYEVYVILDERRAASRDGR